MPTPKELLIKIVVPAVIALLVRLFARGRVGAPAALTLAILAAFWFINRKIPAIPPHGASGWIFYIVILAGVVGLADAFKLWVLPIRAILVAIGGAAAATMLLWFKTTDDWSKTQYAGAIAAAGGVVVLWWSCFEEWTRRDRILSSLPMIVCASAIALLAAIKGSVNFGLLAGAVAACVTAVAIATIWPRESSLQNGITMVVSIALVGLLLASHFLAEVSATDMELVAFAPALGMAGAFVGSDSRNWVRTALALLFLSIPLAVAVGVAIARFDPNL